MKFLVWKFEKSKGSQATKALEGNSSLPNDPPTEADSLTAYTKSLLYRMYLTKGARYQAARRHQRRSMASLWSVISLSMYVFTASAVGAVYDLPSDSPLGRMLSIFNIVMSSFIIAFAVLEQSKKHDLKADLFLRCAQGIQELWDCVDFDMKNGELIAASVKSQVEKYNTIVHDFSDNHSENDYRSFRVNIGKHHHQPFYSFYTNLKYWLDCWIIMLLAVIIPPVAFTILFKMIPL